MANVAEKTGDLLLPGDDIRPEIKRLWLMDGGLQASSAEFVVGETVAFATEDGADGGVGEDVGAARWRHD